MNDTHQALAYTNDAILMDDDVRIIEGNPDELLNFCKDISLAVNSGKTKYMEVERHRSMMANEHITVGSNSYENFLPLVF